MGLEIVPIDSAGISALFELRQKLNNSSLADVSCYYLAQTEGWTLLTNDGAIRKAGKRAELDVKGVLWLLDELFDRQCVLSTTLIQALKAMLEQGARLPEHECQERFKRWSD